MTAWGAGHAKPAVTWGLVLPVLWGRAMAAVLNAANNAINQIYDLDIDRVNKPKRPLPERRPHSPRGLGLHRPGLRDRVAPRLPGLSRRRAASASGSCSSRASLCGSTRRRRCGRSDAASGANITIAIPRGVLLKVAGWSTVKTIFGAEPWYIGAIFGLFLLGAATTKDFADIEGDRAGGCQTLPIVYGVKTAAWIIAPFFVLPVLPDPDRGLAGDPDRQPDPAHGPRARR